MYTINILPEESPEESSVSQVMASIPQSEVEPGVQEPEMGGLVDLATPPPSGVPTDGMASPDISKEGLSDTVSFHEQGMDLVTPSPEHKEGKELEQTMPEEWEPAGCVSMSLSFSETLRYSLLERRLRLKIT